MELLSVDSQEDTSSIIKTQKHEMNVHQVFIDEEIGPPNKYRELISMLYMASQTDTFIFYINSPGGELDSASAIIEAILVTEATVNAILIGQCFSAASFIALNCDDVIVTDSAEMMIHTAQFSAGGNTHSIKGSVDFSHKVINKMLDKTYTGFLTEQEIDSVKKGQEIWLDSEDIKKRLNFKLEHLAKAEAQVAETKTI